MLLDDLKRQIRLRHYSIRTEHAYADWVKRYCYFHDLKHPKDMGASEITAFLSHLASDCDVAASTQNQALQALLFLYRHVLKKDLPQLEEVVRAKRPKKLPVVLSLDETARLLSNLSGVHRIMAELMYATGMRIIELVRLRVKDIDFERNQITVREGKGQKDRSAPLPDQIYTHVMQSGPQAIRTPLTRVRGMQRRQRAMNVIEVLAEGFSRLRRRISEVCTSGTGKIQEATA